MKPQRILSLALIAIAFFATVIVLSLYWKVQAISGVVRDANGQPVSRATVRIKTTDVASRTDAAGRFSLVGFTPAFRVRVTASAEGHRIAGTSAWPWNHDVTLTLEDYPVGDQPEYTWIEPIAEDRPWLEDLWTRTAIALAGRLGFPAVLNPVAARLRLGCADCHAETMFAQWQESSHARSPANIRFLTMYNGSDVNGNQSPPTRFGYSRDYGSFPLPPDPNQLYYGPGYKLDFPNTAGNCAACHAPAAAIPKPYGIDPNKVAGVCRGQVDSPL